MTDNEIKIDKITIETGFARGIGSITIKHALLEALIQNCADILIVGEGANLATSNLPFQKLLNTVGALYKQTPYINQEEKDFEKLNELLTLASDVTEARNKIVHSIWYLHIEDTEKPFTRMKTNIKRKQGLVIDIEKMSELDLTTVIQDLDKAISKAREFTNIILATYGSVLLLTPADGAIISHPTLTWGISRCGTGYEINISQDIDFRNYAVIKTGIRNTQYKCEIPLEQGATYYWRVRPLIASSQGLWSEVRAFKTQ